MASARGKEAAIQYDAGRAGEDAAGPARSDPPVPGLPSPARGLVTIVIPIYNQARFLGEAIESVLAQSYEDFEIVVVDDGSTDDPASVAARYPGVRLVSQPNAGADAARNRGIPEIRGDFAVFLDADDRLLPEALERGVAALSSRPDAALVYGRARMIGPEGSPLRSIQPPHRGETYEALLERCDIWNPASVMCRRFVFDEGAAFDATMAYGGDYLFYLTVARRWAAMSHDHLVCEYRQHPGNHSANGAGMMRYLTIALQAQAAFVRDSPRWRAAHRRGLRSCRRDYYRPAVRQLWKRLRDVKTRKRALRDLRMLLAITPLVLPRLVAGELYRRARRLVG